MDFLMMLIMAAYFALVANMTKGIIARAQAQLSADQQAQENILGQYLVRREALRAERIKLENEAAKIFTLYEMTKEITKTLNEDEAFKVFEKKLAAHMSFQKCYFLGPLAEEAKRLRDLSGHFVLTLQGKSKKIGYVVIQGVSQLDQDKVIILGHQFALALRRVELYKEIERIAITDSLTELHTRRYTMERFQEELHRSKLRRSAVSFLMIDVDLFKGFNDQYGHLTGDQVLRAIAGIVRENIREIDIAGRYGGEEFCVLLPDTAAQGAFYAAERIRQAMERTVIKAYDHALKATVSVGIANFPDHGTDMEELLDKADWALYRAKKLGRNRVCVFGVYNGESSSQGRF